MPKEESIVTEGTVKESLPNAQFRVELENGHTILAYVSGRMRMHFIKILPGDRVTVELSGYDRNRRRITYRAGGAPPRRRQSGYGASATAAGAGAGREGKGREGNHEGQGVDKEALRELPDNPAQGEAPRRLPQPAAQAAAGLVSPRGLLCVARAARLSGGRGPPGAAAPRSHPTTS